MARGKDDENGQEKGSKLQAVQKFLWNGETGKFCGRTGKSWALIGIFYTIFYGCLAAFFAICMSVFLSTLDDRVPRYTGKDTILKGFPGMGFRPQPKPTTSSVNFQPENNETWLPYVKSLKDTLEPYYNQTEGNVVDCNFGTELNKTQVCRFDVSTLGESCTEKNNFGFAEAQPCVLLKMNKVFGWTPKPYSNETCFAKKAENNQDFIDHLNRVGECNNQSVWVTCEQDTFKSTQSTMGDIVFFPKEGFPVQFFPYENSPNYLPPVVFVQFRNATPDTQIKVWCKVFAENTYHNKNDRAGSVQFEINIEGEKE